MQVAVVCVLETHHDFDEAKKKANWAQLGVCMRDAVQQILKPMANER